MTTENGFNIDNFESQTNEYLDYMIHYSKGYISQLFKHGIIDTIGADKLHKMFCNPDQYQEQINDLVQYFYISNADVHQLFEMVEVLPSMNHRIESYSKNNTTANNIKKLNKHLRKIKHKRLTRDLLKQTASSGNTVGIWLGDKANPFPYVFEDIKYAFPIGRVYQGEWVCVLDMSWFDSMCQDEQLLYFDMFKSINITKAYSDYKSDMVNKQYFTLPQDRAFCIGTGKLKRNQVLGTSWGAPGLFDVLHKKKLKDLEQSLANRIINAVAVLTIGTDKVEGKYTNALLPAAVKKKIHEGVKAALGAKEQGSVSVVTIPDYASIEFEEVDVEGLGGDKFATSNSDIKAAYGISGAMTNGEGANYAIAKLNLDIFYKRLAVMLEDVEYEVYNKLFNLMLPKSQSDNYYMNYSKTPSASKEELLGHLKGLSDKGFSVRHYVEELGVDFDEYLDETLFLAEKEKLQQRVIPYATSYTTNGSDIEGINGRPSISDEKIENENTTRVRESQER